MGDLTVANPRAFIEANRDAAGDRGHHDDDDDTAEQQTGTDTIQRRISAQLQLVVTDTGQHIRTMNAP